MRRVKEKSSFSNKLRSHHFRVSSTTSDTRFNSQIVRRQKISRLQMARPSPVASLSDIDEMNEGQRPIGISIDEESDEDTGRSITTPLRYVEMNLPLDFYGVESGGIRTYAPSSLLEDKEAFGGNQELAVKVHKMLIDGEECFCGQRRK